MQVSLINKKINLKPVFPWLIGILSTGVITTSMAVYFNTYSSDSSQEIAEKTVTVESQTLTLTIQASGIVQPVQSVNLSPKKAGILAEIYVKKGDRVEKGTIVARMEDTEIQGRILEAQARLSRSQASLNQLLAGSTKEEIAQVQAQLTKVKSRLNQLQAGNDPEKITQAQARLEAEKAKEQLLIKRVNRYQNLLQEGAISEDTLDEAIADKNTAIAMGKEAQSRLDELLRGSRPEEIAQAQAEVQELEFVLARVKNGSRPEEIAQAQAEVEEAQAQLSVIQAQKQDTIIIAPFTGLITQSYASKGAFVTPTTSASTNMSSTSTSIVTLSRGLEIVAEISEADISKIQQGQLVEITTEAYSDQVFKGHISLIAPQAVNNSNITSFQVHINLETGEHQLLSGMNVRLKIFGKQIEKALVVPNVAILTHNSETGVLFLEDNNQAVFRPVTTGLIIGDKTQILQGLKQGDSVFIDYPETF